MVKDDENQEEICKERVLVNVRELQRETGTCTISAMLRRVFSSSYAI